MVRIEDLVANCLGNDGKEQVYVPRTYNVTYYCGVCNPEKHFRDCCPYLGDIRVFNVGVKNEKLKQVYVCNYGGKNKK